MNVTKLVSACFDLSEGSPTIIIYNFCFVCVGMLCVSVSWNALCYELCCIVRPQSKTETPGRRPPVSSSKTETPCQFKSPPLLSSHGGVFRGQAICLLLIHRPGSPQQVL